MGWYHSHPGYGCWLSGIDVGTQHTQQVHMDPFLAIVIDPHRTIAAGKVEIGAFRTYPEVSRQRGCWHTACVTARRGCTAVATSYPGSWIGLSLLSPPVQTSG